MTSAPPYRARLATFLRTETVGGFLLLGAALLAVLWSGSPWSDAYLDLRETKVGAGVLDLSLGTWAADGLLAIFFFVAGLELKRELVEGELRDPRRAVVPVVAACGGVAVPALVYLAVTAGGDTRGWPVPTATDVAFALAVLALVGRRAPAGLRTFLLTLAVVDDLIAIALIALLFTADLALLPLALAVVPLLVFAGLVRVGTRVPAAVLLLPALATWVLVHESGVHATVAGVLLAFVVPVTGDRARLASDLQHTVHPLSAGVAVPVFAFFAAGVSLEGGLDRTALGVAAGLVAGKLIGVSGSTLLVTRLTGAQLADGLGTGHVLALGALSGIGFTVSLLLADLAFDGGPEVETVTVAVLIASAAAAGLAAVLLRLSTDPD